MPDVISHDSNGLFFKVMTDLIDNP